MNITTMEEEPPFRKCCFYIPLRWCLQTWALLKVLADILVLSHLVLLIAFLYSFNHGGSFWTLYGVYLMGLIVGVLLVDVGFLIALITGIFMKSFKTLRVFYFYEFYMMTVEIIIAAIISVTMIQHDLTQGLLYAAIGVFYIFIDVFISMTVKSEMIKLRNKEQYDFSRMSTKSDDVEGTDSVKFKTEVE